MYNNWHIFFFSFYCALCYIDLCKHDYWTVNCHFCKVFRGGKTTPFLPIVFFFFLLFFPWRLLPYPRGVHYWSWNRNRTIWRFLAGPWNNVNRLTNFVGLFEAFLKKVKSSYRGPFWGHSFWIRTLWLFFFCRRSWCDFTYPPFFFLFFACVNV